MAAANTTKRTRLTAERVLAGALELADEIGVADLTIRRLADALETRPMTIYHHVPSKEAIIDGIVDLVFAEIELPDPDLDWKPAIRARCESARLVLARHPWAVPLMESRRAAGPAILAHHDAVVACLRRGMSLTMTAHAYALIDAFVYGFAIQEAALPATSGDEMVELADEVLADTTVGSYPALEAFAAEHVMQPGYDFAQEFDFGLDLILDGLEHAADRDRSTDSHSGSG